MLDVHMKRILGRGARESKASLTPSHLGGPRSRSFALERPRSDVPARAARRHERIARSLTDSGVRGVFPSDAIHGALCAKISALDMCPMTRQPSADLLLSVSAGFQPGPQEADDADKRERTRVANHLWNNLSFPHVLSHMRSYLSPRERMVTSSVSKVWNDPVANLTIMRLAVARDTAITDATLTKLLTKHRNLRELDVFGCYKLTDAALAKAAAAIPKLRVLNISYCLKFTDAGLRHLATCHELRKIYSAACNRLTSEGMDYLHRAIPTFPRPEIPVPRLFRQRAAYYAKSDDGDKKSGGKPAGMPDAKQAWQRYKFGGGGTS